MTKRKIAVLTKRNIRFQRRIRRIPKHFKAPLKGPSQRISLRSEFWSLLSGTMGILMIYWLTNLFSYPLLIGSFGASAVLLFGVPSSPLAQPRNLIGGHVISATVAVFIVQLFGVNHFSIALAVGLAIFAMNVTRTTHPPGGATALIGVQGAAGPIYVFIPVLAGAFILLVMAIILGNLAFHRKYPQYWI